MPTERAHWTKDGLVKKIGGLTMKIGEAVRNQDDSTANTIRERRGALMRKLAAKFDVWTLVNPEGKTEFVDRAEWEQRMIAWGRRQGLVRRPRVNLDAARPQTPPGGGPPILPPAQGPLESPGEAPPPTRPPLGPEEPTDRLNDR